MSNPSSASHGLAIALLAVSLLFLSALAASAQSDTTAPVVADVLLEPSFVDTSSGPQTITVTMRITDDLSGVSSTELRFRPETGTTQFVGVYVQADDLIGGTPIDGIYQAPMTLPMYAAWGRWRAEFAITKDQVGNYHYRPDCCSGSEILPWYFVNGEDAKYLYLPHSPKH